MASVSAILVLLSSGCAYHWGYSDNSLPGGYTLIAVPVFRNLSQEPGIQVSATTALRTQISRNAKLRIVGINEAPVVARGTIRTVDIVGSGIVRGEEGSSFEDLPKNATIYTRYTVSVHVDLSLVRTSDNRVVWSGSTSASEYYPAPQVQSGSINSANATYNSSARRKAIAVASERVLANLYDSMTEGF